MKIGLCTGLDNLELTQKLGFDYIECMVSAIASLSDGEFAKTQDIVKASPIKVERVNVLFPRTIKLLGPEKDQKAIDEYLEKAFARVSSLGARVVVFGSGAARAVPQEIPFRQGYRELVAATKRIGEIAGNHRLTISIEPLNREESNCINSVKEGAMLEADAASTSVGLLADLYHMLRENESMDNILAVKVLKHTHIALLEGRGFPVKASQEVEAFFDALRKIGYDSTMSIEGRTENLEQDAAAALKVLRSFA
ncbi:MAG: sugar phosphate isomerase/epimerase [Treponema sp.]|jgi:sugar phosphate isomerase/epimerase|nr:sugar phosphate isomerase/epimerase [Treponema sp.]